MARVNQNYVVFYFILLIYSLLVIGCGVKSFPIEKTKFLPTCSKKLEAISTPKGVKVSFWIPSADNLDQKIVQVKLFYAYLPIKDLSISLSCSLQLTNFYIFDLTKYLEGLEGGHFVYLDSNVPMNMQAIYQVVIIDAVGRCSNISPIACAFRLLPPATPTKLNVINKKDHIIISWQSIDNKTVDENIFIEPIRYLVFRKGLDGERRLTARPLSVAFLVDKTITEGQIYFYRVLAVRLVQGTEVIGNSTDWVVASLSDRKKYLCPSGIVAFSQINGVYLRFNHSPTQETIGYFIERRLKKKLNWVRLNTEPWPENTFIDKNVQKGNIYFYRIFAVDETGSISPPTAIAEIRHQP